MAHEALSGPWRKQMVNSPFLAADDFEPNAKPVVLTIKSVSMERPVNPRTTQEEDRPAAHFDETDKLLVLSRTKARAIASLAGSNRMERWTGTRIGLVRGMTKVAGVPTPCIDVVRPPAADGSG